MQLFAASQKTSISRITIVYLIVLLIIILFIFQLQETLQQSSYNSYLSDKIQSIYALNTVEITRDVWQNNRFTETQTLKIIFKKFLIFEIVIGFNIIFCIYYINKYHLKSTSIPTELLDIPPPLAFIS